MAGAKLTAIVYASADIKWWKWLVLLLCAGQTMDQADIMKECIDIVIGSTIISAGQSIDRADMQQPLWKSEYSEWFCCYIKGPTVDTAVIMKEWIQWVVLSLHQRTNQWIQQAFLEWWGLTMTFISRNQQL